MAYYGFGNSADKLTSNGAGSLPSFQGGNAATAFFAYASAIQSNVTGDSTFYLVQFDSTSRNDSSIFDTGTGLCTVNKTGLWNFACSLDSRDYTSDNYYYSQLFEANAGPQYSLFLFNPYPIYPSGIRMIMSGN